MSKRNENGAMILTSNKSFIEWGKVLGDDMLATVILDRLLHHSVTFNSFLLGLTVVQFGYQKSPPFLIKEKSTSTYNSLVQKLD